MNSESRSASGLYRIGFFSVILIVAGLLIYLWGHVQTLSQGREIDRLRAERKALLHQRELLTVRNAGLKQSNRIREIAAKELGMVFPNDPPQNLYLSQ